MFYFGWDDFFESQILDLVSNSLFPARVICEERNLYRVQAGSSQIFWASVSGKMQFNAVSRVDYPAVGDWVMVDLPGQSERGVSAGLKKENHYSSEASRRQCGHADTLNEC